MGRARLDRSPLNVVLTQSVLKRIAGKLSATIGLDALDGERHLPPQVIEEPDGVLGGASRIDLDHHQACAVVDGGVLDATRGDLACVDLDPLARHLFLIALGLPPPALALQTVHAQALQGLVDGRERQMAVMVTLQLDLDVPRSQPSLRS